MLKIHGKGQSHNPGLPVSDRLQVPSVSNYNVVTSKINP